MISALRSTRSVSALIRSSSARVSPGTSQLGTSQVRNGLAKSTLLQPSRASFQPLPRPRTLPKNTASQNTASSRGRRTFSTFHEDPIMPKEQVFKQAFFKPVLTTTLVGVGSFGLVDYLHTHPKERNLWRRTWSRVGEIISAPLNKYGSMMRDFFFEDRTYGERTFWGVFLLNATVFALWKIPSPALTSVLMRNFQHNALRSSQLALVACGFSHKSFLHFGLNMFALSMFLPPQVERWGRYETMAFYTSAITFSSCIAGMIQGLRGAFWASGLGASGGILALVAQTAFDYHRGQPLEVFRKYPDLFQKPMHHAEELLLIAVAFDTIGLFLQETGLLNSILGHDAHLAGVLFAYLYASWIQRQPDGHRPITRWLTA